jgi:hypothetical protein
MTQPRHVVCVLGPWKTFDAVQRIVAELGGEGFRLDDEYSQLEPDDRMPAAFAASADRVEPSIGKADDRAIAKHRAVAYVLSPPLAPTDAQAASARMLAIIGALLDAGSLAVKAESAGIAHGAARWRDLAKAAQSTTILTRANALRLAFVRRPIADDNDILYSCGMHLLGERDAELEASGDVMDDVAWLDMLALYLLAEKPASGVHAGEGFRLTDDGERRVLRAKQCTRYDEDDFFFNPYGYWRLK